MRVHHRVERTWQVAGTRVALIEATEPERGPDVHPLVHSVSGVHRRDDVDHWIIHEHLPIGPLTLPNAYRVSRKVLPDRIVLRAWSRPGIHLVHTLLINGTDGALTVRHTVDIDAPLWTMPFVRRTAAAAHDDWIAHLRDWVETHSASGT